MFLFLGTSSEQAEQFREKCEQKASADRLKAVRALERHCLNPTPNKRIGELLKKANTDQIAAVRKHLRARESYWSSMTARIEAANVVRAIQALDEGNYSYGHIGANLDNETINSIFGCK